MADGMLDACRNPHRMIRRHHPSPLPGRDHHDTGEGVEKLCAAVPVRLHAMPVRKVGCRGDDGARRGLDPVEPMLQIFGRSRR